VNNRNFRIGRFEVPTLDTLRKDGQNNAKRGRLTVRHDATEDVLLDHALPQNRNALFQVASQFNCLEFIHAGVIPEHGITMYANDPTQGPACAIAAGPATVYRNYFVNMDSQEGQTEHCQLNTLSLLEDVVGNQGGKYWTVQNGYTNSTQYKLQELCKKMGSLGAEELDCWRDCIQIGLQTDAQVTFSDRGELHPAVLGDDYVEREGVEKQLVTQAFCSALSVSYSGLPSSLWEPLGRLILQATYEATMWAAVKNGVRAQPGVDRPTVLLTFLGGGAFGNPTEWIVDAIGRALAIMEVEQVDIDVRIMHFRHVSMSIQQQIAEKQAQWRDRLNSAIATEAAHCVRARKSTYGDGSEETRSAEVGGARDRINEGDTGASVHMGMSAEAPAVADDSMREEPSPMGDGASAPAPPPPAADHGHKAL
jgi:hypothetical protein